MLLKVTHITKTLVLPYLVVFQNITGNETNLLEKNNYLPTFRILFRNPPKQ